MMHKDVVQRWSINIMVYIQVVGMNLCTQGSNVTVQIYIGEGTMSFKIVVFNIVIICYILE